MGGLRRILDTKALANPFEKLKSLAMIINPQTVASLLEECSERFIMPRFQALGEDDVQTKTGPRDLVTKADIEAEAHLEKILPDLYPGSFVVGEEGVSRGDVSLDRLAEQGADIWVVDPVDGTFNFAHGNENFGIMIAFISGGVVRNSWIYHPVQKAMYIAERGAGAYKDNERLKVSSARKMSNMDGHVSRRYFPDHMKDLIHERMTVLKSWKTIGAAAHEYARIAEGLSDVAIYSRLKPWDHLPGSLLVEEAGGYIAKWNGQPYTIDDQYAGLIVTNSAENWRELHDYMFKGFDF